jgi:hypothetical protein
MELIDSLRYEGVMYRPTFSWPRHKLKVSGQLQAPSALPPGKEPRYPLDRRLGGPQSRSGWHGEVKILTSTGTRTLTPWSSSPSPIAIPTAPLSKNFPAPDYILSQLNVVQSSSKIHFIIVASKPRSLKCQSFSFFIWNTVRTSHLHRTASI